jgi:hypothetical protein
VAEGQGCVAGWFGQTVELCLVAALTSCLLPTPLLLPSCLLLIRRLWLGWLRCRGEQVLFEGVQCEQHEEEHDREEQGYYEHGAFPLER